MKNSYPYCVGAFQGAVRTALIHLKYGRTEDAARILREVLVHVNEELSIKTPERKTNDVQMEKPS
jgi:hypothetical protein